MFIYYFNLTIFARFVINLRVYAFYRIDIESSVILNCQKLGPVGFVILLH